MVGAIFSWRGGGWQSSGALAPRERCFTSSLRAAAKQSSGLAREAGLLRRVAPRNDEVGAGGCLYGVIAGLDPAIHARLRLAEIRRVV
jgi:hypothetical protein